MAINICTIAGKNVRRRLFRSLAIFLSVAILTATLFTITTVVSSVKESLRKGRERLGADIMVVPQEAEMQARAAFLAGEPSTFHMDRKVLEEIRGVEGVGRVSSQIYLKTLRLECCTVGDVFVVGFNPENDFTIMPWLERKRKRIPSSGEVIIGSELVGLISEASKARGSDIPSIVKLFGNEFKITGRLDETGMKFIDSSIYVPVSGLKNLPVILAGNNVKALPLDKISAVLVQVAPGADPYRTALFIEYEIPGIKAMVSEEVNMWIRKQLFAVLESTVLITVLSWIMAFVLISTIFSLSVNERRREIGLIRAVGAKRMDVFYLIMTEATLLSVLGSLAGVASGSVFLYFFSGYIRSSLEIPYLWPSAPDLGILLIMCVLLSFVTGTGAGLYSAFRATKMEPYEAMRTGE